MGGGIPLVARYTSSFDAGEPTQWWFCIKDTPLDIENMKSKRRYELNKGYKNFDVKKIVPQDYSDEMFCVFQAALRSYSKSTHADYDKFLAQIQNWQAHRFDVYGAFSKKSGVLAAYAMLRHTDNYIAFSVLKADPLFEREGVNAAIVRFILESNAGFLANGGYIDDGERAMFHETHFQDYLEKYFGFRRAYCQLHIEYNPKIKSIMELLFRCRKLIFKINNRYIHPLHCMLKMEEIARGVNLE